MKILIVEDEKRMADLLRRGLEEEGNTAICTYDGEEGYSVARACHFDIIVLDLMLPKANGYEVTRRLREESNLTPILMLTARDTVQDVVNGLDLGADDYLTKPFSFEELLARLRALTRRGTTAMSPRLQVGDLLLDPAKHEVTRAGIAINLSRTEYKLLEHLMLRRGHVVPRRALMDAIWGCDREIEKNTLDAFVRLLRNKVDAPGHARLIHTSRGLGYFIRQDEP